MQRNNLYEEAVPLHDVSGRRKAGRWPGRWMYRPSYERTFGRHRCATQAVAAIELPYASAKSKNKDDVDDTIDEHQDNTAPGDATSP